MGGISISPLIAVTGAAGAARINTTDNDRRAGNGYLVNGSREIRPRIFSGLGSDTERASGTAARMGWPNGACRFASAVDIVLSLQNVGVSTTGITRSERASQAIFAVSGAPEAAERRSLEPQSVAGAAVVTDRAVLRSAADYASCR